MQSPSFKPKVKLNIITSKLFGDTALPACQTYSDVSQSGTPHLNTQITHRNIAQEGRNPIVKNGVYKFGEQMLSKDGARVHFNEGTRNYFSITTKHKTA